MIWQNKGFFLFFVVVVVVVFAAEAIRAKRGGKTGFASACLNN